MNDYNDESTMEGNTVYFAEYFDDEDGHWYRDQHGFGNPTAARDSLHDLFVANGYYGIPIRVVGVSTQTTTEVVAMESVSANAKPTEADAEECECMDCAPTVWSGLRMFLCPQCGNKRCPHATHHGHACTGSNEPGQWGSAYGVRVTPDELARHDADVAARAVDDAATVFATGAWFDAFLAGNVDDDVSAVRATEAWLRDRAAAIRGGAR